MKKKKEHKAESPYDQNYVKCVKHLSLQTITRKEKGNMTYQASGIFG